MPFAKRKLTRIARHGGAVDYRYDRFGRLTQDGALTFTYDANDNPETIGYPGGVEAVYTHDYADRPATLLARRPGKPDQPLASSAAYAPGGPLSSLVLGNGLTEARTFDDRYHPTGITLGSLLNWVYTTDDVGNILSITDALNAANSRTYGYRDFQYSLTQGNGPWGTRSWTYDKIGNRLTEARGAVTDTYSYLSNGAGRTPILSQIQLGAGGTKTYQYGPAGHLEKISASTDQTLFLSDDAGRLARLESVSANTSTRFLYDGRSFLSHAEKGVVQFKDGFEAGTLCNWTGSTGSSKTCPSPLQTRVEPTYTSDGLLHALTRDTAPERSFAFHFAGRPVAQLDLAGGAETWKYLTTDHLGTPIAATSAAGTLLWQGGFEPFGTDWSNAAGVGVFLRFPGQWEEGVWAGAELYYNVHRWYEVGTGRYTRPDPLASSAALASLRLFMADLPTLGHVELPSFLYAEGAPVNFVDVLGLVALGPFKSCVVTGDVITSSEAAGENTISTPVGPYHYQRRRITGRICFFRCYCDRKDNCPKIPCLNPFCPRDHGVSLRLRFFDKKGVRPCKTFTSQALKRGKCPLAPE